MTKKINRANIASRLQSKFLLSNTANTGEFELEDTIQPVTIVDDFVLAVQAQSTSSTAASRTDTYTVPSGKVWKVQVISGARANAAAIIAYINTPAAAQVDLTLGAATDIDYRWIGPQITLSAGWAIIISFSAAASGVLRSSILYEEYDQA